MTSPPPPQKHALLLVPDYTAESAGDAPLTYLALGSHAATHEHLLPERARGDDLLAAAGWKPGEPFFEDDQRASQVAGSILPPEQQHGDGGTVLGFTGARYHRYDGEPDHATSTTDATRQELTDELLSRGGWRDHTDGNRIVTVRGDRVDVVMGNYKRVVLGRVEPIEGALDKSSWEVSGGHIFERTSTGCASLQSIEWVRESQATDGSDTYWKVVEDTQRCDVFTRYSGRTEEHYNGPSLSSTTGVDGSDPSKNPHIRERSVIASKSSSTSAKSIRRDTTVDTLDEYVFGDPGSTFNSFTLATVAVDTVGFGGTPPAVFREELYTVGQFNFDIFGGALSLGFYGATLATAGNSANLVAGGFLSASATGGSFELFVGTKATARIGTSLSFFAGKSDWTLTIGGPVDLNAFALAVEIKSKDGNLFEGEIKGSKVVMSAVKTRSFTFRNRT